MTDRAGARLVLVCASPRVLKLFRITGLDDAFEVCAELNEALPSPGDRPETLV